MAGSSNERMMAGRSSGDSRNDEMVRWLQMMGFPGQLSDDDLDQLNHPSMRSVWRHLQTHVKPAKTVQNIRRNLLLARLKGLNKVPSHARQSKLESINDLQQAINIAGTQSKIDNIKSEMNMIDEQTVLNNTLLIEKLNEKEFLKDEVRKCEEKTRLIQLKYSQVDKEVKELCHQVPRFQCYVANRITDPVKASETINEVSKALYSKLCHLKMNAEGIANVVLWLQQYPAYIIYKSIYNVVRLASRRMCNDINKLDIQAEYNKEVTSVLENKQVLSMKSHLLQLYTQIVDNQLTIDKSVQNLHTSSIKFEEDMNSLKLKLIELTVNTNEIERGVMRVLNKKEIETLTTSINKLKEEFSDLGNLNENCDETNKESYETNYQNFQNLMKYLREVSGCGVESMKVEVSNNCLEMSTNFINKYNRPRDNKQLQIFNKYKALLEDEIKLFVMTDFDIIIRNWENNLSPSHPQLDSILMQNQLYHSEPKNVLKKVLEKIVWLLESE